MRLNDKVTVITGAGHGIGRAYARRFAEEGAHVVIAEIDAQAGERVAAEITGAGKSAWSRPTDVTRFDDVQGLVKETVDRFGRIDVLLNNAAIYVTQPLTKCSLEDLSLEEWDRVIEVNLKGVFLCCKAVIPVMKKQRSGKIINVASGTFFHGTGNMPHYTASKGGVVALTRVLAKQLGPWNVNVNCLTPGSTMSEEKITEEVRKRREESSRQRAFQRIEVPEDITGTALFLASSDSDFMTGQLLVVDGGGILH
ncbi:MAG TPA: 3-oxoacyl-ACP reductase family protein [Candidatus Acidoferrales bacterium]|nr:3-oxoacyl-ACP reductase family protein [Candidatus Acidoferrales bacterium]